MKIKTTDSMKPGAHQIAESAMGGLSKFEDPPLHEWAESVVFSLRTILRVFDF